MSHDTSAEPTAETAGEVRVRYWAAARAAAGVETDVLTIGAKGSLAEVLEEVRLRHVDSPKFKDVVSVCSVLIGDRPVGTADPAQVMVCPGDTVELLPPFAGG